MSQFSDSSTQAALPGGAPLETAAEELGPAASTARVLHINSGNLYGGVESILLTLARCRDQCSTMESHFALCHEGRLSNELKQAGAPVHILGRARISRPWTVVRARRQLRRLLAGERFDLVICHMPWSLALFGNTVTRARQRLGFWAHGLHSGRNWLERLALRTRPDVVIANSRFTESGVANLFPHTMRAVIYPPVALDASQSLDQHRSAIRRQLGVDDDSVVVIQVGRMEACKGHLMHLQALSQMKSSTKWICWMIGGAQTQIEEEYFQGLQRAARELGIADKVRFLGQRSDVPQLLAAADIFCQPNISPDSFGLVFVEALWAGRPVITTAMGGAIEIIDDTCGVLVEPNDRPALMAALEKLIESPVLRQRFRQAGAARAMQLCDPAANMRALCDLCRAGVVAAAQAPISRA
jgi:glycosyltransferase involved in cell wall biosynthesis